MRGSTQQLFQFILFLAAFATIFDLMQKLFFCIAFLLSLVLVVGQLNGCTKDEALLTNPNIDCVALGEISFEHDVKPIFVTYCTNGTTGCHASWITSHSSVERKVKNGTMELRVIAIKDMPPANNEFNIPALPEEAFNKIHCWIAQGAQNN